MTDTIKCTRTATELQSGHSAFGLYDQKGRETGYRWSISSLAIRPIPADHRFSYYSHPVGQPMDQFRVWGSPTRGGKNYGPAFNYAAVLTLDEAELLVAKRISNARNRDTKRWAAKVPA